MKDFPYEHLAMRGEEMPDGMDSPDQAMYLKMRLLYDAYKKGVVTREVATREKAKLKKQYEFDCLLYQLDMKRIEKFIKAEIARAEYRKNRTLENADNLVKCLDGVEVQNEK